ncbi:unnamed protein product [Chilo suppressalis]|uniref:BED-type domain-containing protein n=1 Tax=Chilo suppressalis TaxID=168631 RepID=A0ABN8BCB5_CHISP|nr:unnamed protein product [Chilo suppressalis]
MATKRKYSPLWTHFEEVAEKKARCLYCSKAIAFSSSSIGSLSRHMKALHPTVNINDKRQDRVDNEETAVQNTNSRCIPPDNTAGKSTTSIPAMTSIRNTTNIQNYIIVKRPIPINRVQQLDEQLIIMIAKGYHAFRLVEEPEFKKFTEMLNPSYSLPTRKTLSDSILPKLYNKLLEASKIKIAGATAICITTDGWTSTVNDGFIAITAHYIEQENSTIHSVMIGCINFEERHTSANLKDFLHQKFVEWGIQHKIGAVVSDNAANIVGAVQLGGWRSIRCFAHCLNLVVQQSLISISATVTKVKHVVEYFHRSIPGAKKLCEIQQQMNLTPLKLKQDVVTRWNSTFEMLQRFLQIKSAVIATLALMRDDLALSQDDWIIIENALPILKIFNDVTVEISGEKYVTASKYIVFCKLINIKLIKLPESEITPIKNLIADLKTHMLQRFHDIESNVLLCEATILDPRFKKNGFSDPRKYERAASHLKQKIGAADATPASSEHVDEDNSDVPPAPSEAANSIWAEFDVEVSKLVPQNSLAAGIVEFDKYIQEPLITRLENPLSWWKERKAVYPRLYAYMLKRLNITATSVPCERVFSKAGLTLNERRTRLTTKKLSQLMFISCNI